MEGFFDLTKAQEHAMAQHEAGHQRVNVQPSMLYNGPPFWVHSNPLGFYDGISVGRPFRPRYRLKRGKVWGAWTKVLCR
jgi:hypothetical protein